MNTAALFLIALGLSMDAFAVSVTNSMCYPNLGRKKALFTSLCFGLFQGIMPVLGFLAGRAFSEKLDAFDHWVAFILLGIVGGKMLIDALREWREPLACPTDKTLTVKLIFVQAIATSIDALAVGISFAALGANIFSAASFIAVTTFICCLLGHLLGKKAGKYLGNWAQIAGGVILIGIGVKILLEHLTA